ncbi:MAG TPA: bile acid:sodium symporter family protein [Bacteroidales bacterium]|nr:bile acid:sodium symporter family protein [Bacteroidales bacterium]
MSLNYMDYLVSGVLATIMFGVGLSINLNDLRNILHSPKPFWLGLFAQMILLPLIAFAVIYFAGMPPALKVGFIILAACPGGTTSGFITVLYRGNVALSVALTTINSILTLFTIPLLVNVALTIFLGRHSPFDLPFLETFLQIFFVTLLPAAAGVFIRYRYDNLADRVQKPVKTAMIILFAGVYSLIAFADESKGGSGIRLAEAIGIFPYALLINLLGFIAGLVTGVIGKSGLRSSFTMGIEVALQNTTLALLVAGTILQNNEMVKPALVYALFSFWTALLYGIVIKKYNKAKLFGEFR